MSKRELSHHEEEKFSGSIPNKKVKSSQNPEIVSIGSLSPSQQRQNHSNHVVRLNSVLTKPSQDFEEDIQALISEQKQTVTEELDFDADSDTSYYR